MRVGLLGAFALIGAASVHVHRGDDRGMRRCGDAGGHGSANLEISDCARKAATRATARGVHGSIGAGTSSDIGKAGNETVTTTATWAETVAVAVAVTAIEMRDRLIKRC